MINEVDIRINKPNFGGGRTPSGTPQIDTCQPRTPLSRMTALAPMRHPKQSPWLTLYRLTSRHCGRELISAVSRLLRLQREVERLRRPCPKFSVFMRADSAKKALKLRRNFSVIWPHLHPHFIPTLAIASTPLLLAPPPVPL